MREHRYLWIVNDFMHDLGTGVWAACLLVAWVLRGQMSGMPAEAAAAIQSTLWLLWWLAIGALVVIGGTGGARLRYWRRESDPADIEPKRRSLLVKHVVFLVVYGIGTLWLWTLVA
jgi:hypothetical protein